MKLAVMLKAYNHEAFIAQAIESALAQRTSFPFEIIIGEDRSTDRTREIVDSWAARHPNRIRVLERPQSVGMVRNTMDLYMATEAAYAAWLDGDDYWTSPDKLQRQVDLLDARPHLSMCFHEAERVGADGVVSRWSLATPGKNEYGIEDLLVRPPGYTSTCVYRRLLNRFPDWFERLRFCDWPLQILHAAEGPAGWLPEIMSVYRERDAAAAALGFDPSGRLTRAEFWAPRHAEVYHLVNRHFGYQYRWDHRPRARAPEPRWAGAETSRGRPFASEPLGLATAEEMAACGAGVRRRRRPPGKSGGRGGPSVASRPDGPMTLLDLLGGRDDSSPAIGAVEGGVLSSGQLRAEIARHARALAGCDIGRGDAVALVAPNGPEALVATLAVAEVACVAPLNPAFTEAEFRFYLEDSRRPRRRRVGGVRRRGRACRRCLRTAGPRPAAGGGWRWLVRARSPRTAVATGGTGPEACRRHGAPPPHLGDDLSPETRRARPRVPLPVGAGDRRVPSPRSRRRLPERDAAVPRARPDRRRPVVARGRRRGLLRPGLQPAPLPPLARGVGRHLVHGRPHHSPDGGRARRFGGRRGPGDPPLAQASSGPVRRRCRCPCAVASRMCSRCR